MEKAKLKDLAGKLMFDMSDQEYETLSKEFDFFLAQMKKIEKLDHITEVEPMTFPFANKNAELREDEIGDYLTVDEVLSNAKSHLKDQVKVPKVVE